MSGPLEPPLGAPGTPAGSARGAGEPTSGLLRLAARADGLLAELLEEDSTWFGLPGATFQGKEHPKARRSLLKLELEELETASKSIRMSS